MWDSIQLILEKGFLREIARLVIRGLAHILPIAILALFVAFKSKNRVNDRITEDFENYKGLDKETQIKEAANRLTNRGFEKRRRFYRLFLLMIILPATLATICYYIKGLRSYLGEWDWLILFLLFFFLLFIPVLLREPYAKDLTGKISTKDANYLLKTKIPFSFFLRSFQTDTYSESGARQYPFNEDILANSLKRRFIRLYALGNPVELDRPQGGKRVYVVGDWEETVKKIIRRAKHVYMRVSTSDGCTKELPMVLDVLKKATLIVDRAGYYDYNELRRNHQELPAIEPITGDYLYFISIDKRNDWVIEKMVNTGVAYKHYPAKKHYKKDPILLEYYRERALKSLIVPIFIGIVVFMMINPKEDTSNSHARIAEQEWINNNVPECPIEIDSTLFISNCLFNNDSLIIHSILYDRIEESNDETLAVLCFFHLNHYDLENVRECYRLISRNNASLRIEVKNIHSNQLTLFEYTNETDFDRVWNICRHIEQDRIAKQHEIEASDPNARIKRIRDSFKEIRSRNLAY